MSSRATMKMKRVSLRNPCIAHSTTSSISRKSSRSKRKDQSFTDSSTVSKEANTLGLFPNRQVHEIMLQVMNSSEFAKNPKYDPACGVQGVLQISDEIRNKVKTLLQKNAHERYKIVVNVLAGSTSAADMAFVSRSVWNTNTDTFVEAKLELHGKYLIAVLYAVEQD